MKMKKLLILVSMLAVMLSFAGCDNTVPKPFNYNEQAIVVNTMDTFSSYSMVSSDYADYYLSDGSDFEKSAVKGIMQAKDTDNVGMYQDYSVYADAISAGVFDIASVNARIEEGADYVTVTITNKATNRDVDISVKYVENADYYIQLDQLSAQMLQYYTSQGFSEAQILAETGADSLVQALGIEEYLQQNGTFPYVAEEMVVSAVYSKAELIKQAGMNTIIGMATVFLVLIFISFIISLFKFLPALFAKKPKLPVEEPTKKVEIKPAAQTVVPAANNDLMNDAELVAVITAAIYAASSANGGAVSKDQLVVRSIRRATR